ncbi:MAG: FKBP-type peptidyl-prolyl cis-trans isomerase [Candidatus Marinimicrobia bacterium]|jgi:FKBP-type peptidyl-prolyl cis-trans isomerase|nr:FKBP-type peptidyl-prolyl cis-trans isomerase [Candidatus Neomarinimicrobiota bacterium]MBT3938015.1 FKBP-type peptidyl-prolyl cis-trans isomerase [Candidatus Neomarinimicrobiota bacterium]MBT3961573.1 FKBP-type peptidyl-prolyl cis-trans isomerase [Candidatus Neomarinimicrobiota bacterium]MBT4382039.1 FKBP-type peptidyl-prolyl cis-trans isomerase [Candidatus Neomarinimicrobiota bacterium]MBT4636106.1 FKBP-type peptidyl-prolyl cis-trans isomerase [Candidatus Neomarinimicrobiota bacterium]
MKLKLAATVIIGSLMVGCVDGGHQDISSLGTESDSLSYTLGIDIGENFKREMIDLDYDVFFTGIKHGFGDGEVMLTKDERNQTIRKFQKTLRDNQKAKAEINIVAGEEFLETNKAKEGVQETPTGLQYKVIQEGNGDSPTASDKVKVHYSGKLIDGTEFDSSYSRGEPATFSVGGVIKGWKEGIQLMKVGAKFEFYIPSNLAYGPRPSATIPANSTLIFEVELLEIVK